MKFLIGLSVFFCVFSAQAEINFSPSFSYFKLEDENGGAATSELELTTYDFKLGYVHSSGLFLGGMYQMSKFNDDQATAVGPTLGFKHYSGFYALFTYFLMAEQESGASTTFTDGMGPQIDVGWMFPLTYMFYIGPQISYRSINYSKVDISGASVETDFTRSNVLPYISLWFRF